MFFAESECGSTLPSSVAHQPGLGRHLRGFVPVEDFFCDRPGLIERGDRREEVIGAQILALEHATAAEDVPFVRRAGPIEAASEPVELFQDGDVVAQNIRIADKEYGGGE